MNRVLMLRKYMVRIEGRGLQFVVRSSLLGFFHTFGLGKPNRCTGFFTTRYVVAESEEAASQTAKKLITEELVEGKFVSRVDLQHLDLRVDEVAPISESHEMKPNRGFTFFEK